MKCTIVAAILAFTSGIVAQAIDTNVKDLSLPTDDMEHKVVCETSDDSPYLHHVEQLINGLRGEKDNDQCFNQNVGRRDGLKCGKTVRDYSGNNKGAAFQMCKTKKVDGPKQCGRNSPGPVSCDKCDGYSAEHVAFFIGAIKLQCESNSRAGGKVEFKEGGDLRLYSMPG